MRKVLALALGLFAVATLGSAPAAAADGFYIANQSDQQIWTVEVKRSDATLWSLNLLGSGNAIRARSEGWLPLPTVNACVHDIYIEDQQGGSRTYWSVDLCSYRGVNFP